MAIRTNAIQVTFQRRAAAKGSARLLALLALHVGGERTAQNGGEYSLEVDGGTERNHMVRKVRFRSRTAPNGHLLEVKRGKDALSMGGLESKLDHIGVLSHSILLCAH